MTPMLIYTTLAGACILAGAIVARIEHIHPRWLENELRHSIIAFGGGTMIAAVSLVLVPEGLRYFPSTVGATLIFLLGGFAFFAVERHLGIRRRETPMLSTMLLDYIPETLALGGMFASGAPAAPLLAVLIGLQNLPEGFNSYRELQAKPDFSRRGTLWFLCALVPIGPLVGTAGWLYAAGHPALLGAVMLFSAGGILYLLFQDVAPQSRLNRHWAPALGAVLGFGAGMLGKLLVP